jgi:hypothetical protein
MTESAKDAPRGDLPKSFSFATQCEFHLVGAPSLNPRLDATRFRDPAHPIVSTCYTRFLSGAVRPFLRPGGRPVRGDQVAELAPSSKTVVALLSRSRSLLSSERTQSISNHILLYEGFVVRDPRECSKGGGRTGAFAPLSLLFHRHAPRRNPRTALVRCLL